MNDKIDFVYFTTYTQVPEFESTIIDNGSVKFISSSWEKTIYIPENE